MKTLSYREKQNLIKDVSRRAILDQDFRKLCLTDSNTALETVLGRKLHCPEKLTFLEEDGVEIEKGEFVIVLPAFLKKTWLSD
ncbi:MAG: hypothetical protein RBT41_04730 [Clostridia bacterium]|jgi:hypothetical protein|nr:hypothetical protein [Clostridia bacterium]